ncbi:GbsR/MarR family transcriptional regulator [Yoonia sediminilitoris]|uniref:MarR family protein n=1 Tax=Yoonia sediminilitoris TaxID=1286148 RepID=A0A2T6KHB4_9RHOB|nr:MarR family transcriptional regulator [Yoonia sediminilitoris]PUB14902.1 MarR family protein [Yoonia sediminilitoris]RCW95619.1 MarR family protein [Yoonia sediminilitoris]
MTDGAPVSDTRAEFIEKIGLITQAEGMPRIAGRVFGMLIFDGEAASFGDLATRLQVSRGSISSSIRLLEERGLVKRIAKPGDRQDYFQLAPNPYVSMLEGVQKRARSTRDEITHTINALPAGSDAINRLQEYANFYAKTAAAIGTVINALHTSKACDTGQAPAAPKDDDHEN